MVAGLTRVESTIRSLNCPGDQRVPAPARSGASVPWNRSSGNGPAVAEQAEPDLPVGDDRAALGRIALGAGQRMRDGVADDS